MDIKQDRYNSREIHIEITSSLGQDSQTMAVRNVIQRMTRGATAIPGRGIRGGHGYENRLRSQTSGGWQMSAQEESILVKNVIVHLLHVEAVAVRVTSNPTLATSVAPATGTILHADGLL
jgi:hypothetical protein